MDKSLLQWRKDNFNCYIDLTFMEYSFFVDMCAMLAYTFVAKKKNLADTNQNKGCGRIRSPLIFVSKQYESSLYQSS